jgi:hypothetical protein
MGRDLMFKKTLLVFGVLFSTAVLPIRADWQYTKWGMTEDEVVAASQGAAKALSPSERAKWKSDPSLSAVYVAGDLKFTAFFSFEKATKGLSEVSLHLDSPSQAVALRDGLISKYGKPGREEGSMSEKSSISTSEMESRNQSIEWWTDRDHIMFFYSELGLSPMMQAMISRRGKPVPPPSIVAGVTYSTTHPKDKEGL